MAKKMMKNILKSIENWSKNKIKHLFLCITRANLRNERIQEKIIVPNNFKSDNFIEKPAWNRWFLRCRRFLCSAGRAWWGGSSDPSLTVFGRLWPEWERELVCPSKFKTHLSVAKLKARNNLRYFDATLRFAVLTSLRSAILPNI